jgi:hypothetical protein
MRAVHGGPAGPAKDIDTMRRIRSPALVIAVEIQFHDRSVLCTAALAVYLAILLPRCFRANWNASKQRKFFRNRFSLYATWALSSLLKHGGSVSKSLYALNKYMNRHIEPWDSRLSPSNPEACLIESRRSSWHSRPYRVSQMKPEMAPTSRGFYSDLKACIGSIEAARRAGTNPATAAHIDSAMVAPRYATGSLPLTS